MYSVTNFAFSDFYKRLDLRRDLAAERLLNGKKSEAEWSLSYVEELNNQREFIVEYDDHNHIISNKGLNPDLWNQINKQKETNLKDGNIFY